MKKWKRYLKKHERQIMCYSGIIALAILAIALFFNVFKAIIVIILFILANCFIRFYKRVIPVLPIELEISMFATMLTTVAYGFWVGLLTALLTSIAAEFFTQMIKPFSLVNIITYAVVAIPAIFLSSQTIIVGGLTIVVLANIVIFTIFLFMGYDMFKNLAYSVTNIVFNYFMFTYLAVPILNIIMV